MLDRCHRVAYACWSPRTTPGALQDFAARLGYRVVSFDARGPGGQQIYHTNVMMAIGERFVLICPEAIPDADERAIVLRELEQGGRELIPISIAQMGGFAGNLLALRSGGGEPLITMSAAAWDCLRRARTPRARAPRQDRDSADSRLSSVTAAAASAA